MKMQKQFRYITLKEEMRYVLDYVCSSCGYAIKRCADMSANAIPDKVSELTLGSLCPNCEEGAPRFVSSMLYNELTGISFNASVLRIYNDLRYLEEAFRNPCSTNICNCNKYTAYLAVAANKRSPFICGHCTKLFGDALLFQRKSVGFPHLYILQINIFRDYFAEYYNWETGVWVQPDNGHNRYRPFIPDTAFLS